jgi:hypothetical protein
VEVIEQQDARKARLSRGDALHLASQADEIYAAKGKSVAHFDLKKHKPREDELTQVLLGPTGNLRAPALRVGKTLIIGFEPEMYRRLLGQEK